MDKYVEHLELSSYLCNIVVLSNTKIGSQDASKVLALRV